MTLEEALDPENLCQLEKLSDEELLKHFQQYLCVTRPELAPRNPTKTQQPAIPMTPQKLKALEALAATGMDMSFLRHRKK